MWRWAFGDALRGVAAQVEDEELICLTAAVSFFRTEVARLWRVNNLIAVRRQVPGTGCRHRESSRGTAINRNFIQTRNRKRPRVSQRTKDDVFAVLRPTKYLVVPTPARRERSACRIERQLPRVATGSGNHVDLLVTVVLASKRDPLSVRRKLSKDFDAWMRSQTCCGTAAGGRRPKIAGVCENDAIASNVGKSQEFCLGISCGCKKTKMPARASRLLVNKGNPPKDYPQISQITQKRSV